MLALPALPINPPAASLGRVNAVLTGTSRRYHVPDCEGCLSLKTVVAGSAVWQAGGRRYAVHEHCFLILNDRQRYTIDIQAGPPTTTFCLFFARGFVEDIWRSTIRSDAELLDTPQVSPDAPSAGFFERLEPASSPVLAQVRSLRETLRAPDLDIPTWEDHFTAVAAELVQAQRAVTHAATRLSAARTSTRVELCRRLLRGRDILLTAWEQPPRLQDIAAGACLSPYHFHRAFTRLFGRTPHQLLTEYRLERVSAQLRQSNRSILELCLEAGFQSPASFSTLFRRRYGMSPREYRRIKRTVCKFASFDKNGPRG